MGKKNQVFSVTVENGIIKNIKDSTYADKERHELILTREYAINITGEHKNNYLELTRFPNGTTDIETNNLQHGQLSEQITKRILDTKKEIPSTILVNGKEVSYESFCKTLVASETNLLLKDMKENHGVAPTGENGHHNSSLGKTKQNLEIQ